MSLLGELWLHRGTADRKQYMQKHTAVKKRDSWMSAGSCICLGSQLGNWCGPRDRLWPVHAESRLTFQGVWICCDGSGGVIQVFEVKQEYSYVSLVWRRNWNPTTRANDICDTVVVIGQKHMMGPKVELDEEEGMDQGAVYEGEFT